MQDTLSQLARTKDLLEFAGYQSLVYEDFYEPLEQTIKRIVNAQPGAPKLTARGLLDVFNDAEGTCIPPVDIAARSMLIAHWQCPTQS